MNSNVNSSLPLRSSIRSVSVTPECNPSFDPCECARGVTNIKPLNVKYWKCIYSSISANIRFNDLLSYWGTRVKRWWGVRSSWTWRKILRLDVSAILTEACTQIIRLVLIHSVGVMLLKKINKADKLGLLYFLTTPYSLIILAIVNAVKCINSDTIPKSSCAFNLPLTPFPVYSMETLAVEINFNNTFKMVTTNLFSSRWN